MTVHLELLAELHQTFREGKPQGEVWHSQLSPDFAQWRRGRDGSMNLPRLARAVQCAVEPKEAAAWWQELLRREQEAIEDDDRLFRWCGWECFSPYYWGWIWLAEVCALRFLAARSEAEPTIEAALERLRRALRIHASLFTLTALPDWIVRGQRDQVRFRGAASLCAGLRGAPTRSMIRDVNTLGTRAVGRPAEPDKIKGEIREMADAITDWGLGDDEETLCRAFLDSALPERSEAVALMRIVGDVRTVVPYVVRRYADGSVVTWIEHNASGNTSAVWYVRQGPGPEQIEQLFPYSQRRIRGGHPELGRGEGQVLGPPTAERFVCSGLTAEEAERRGVERTVASTTLPGAEPVLEVRFQNEAAPLVHWQGEHLENLL